MKTQKHYSRALWPLTPNFHSQETRIFSFFIQIIILCWAPYVLQFQSTEFSSIFSLEHSFGYRCKFEHYNAM